MGCFSLYSSKTPARPSQITEYRSKLLSEQVRVGDKRWGIGGFRKGEMWVIWGVMRWWFGLGVIGGILELWSKFWKLWRCFERVGWRCSCKQIEVNKHRRWEMRMVFGGSLVVVEG